MTILFNTARSRYPDITGSNSGEFSSQIQNTLSRVLSSVGARVFQNSFIEDGTMRVPGTSFAGSHISDVVAPSKRKILSQDVQPSVIIKKRMFSTLRDSFDTKYFDEKEQLYIRAVKTLFRKKCEDIAFYESLIFIDKIIEDPDFVYGSGALGNFFNALFDITAFGTSNSQLLDVLGATETSLSAATNNLINGIASSNPWLSQLFKIREISQQSKQSQFTTWISDARSPDLNQTGPGVGVIEFTMMSRVNTSTSLSTGAGTCQITLQDPYRLSMISESDIDRALKEAYLENGRIPSYITERAKQLSAEAMRLDNELNASRRARGVSEVNFDFPFGTDTSVSATLIELNQQFNETDLIYGTTTFSTARRFVSDLRSGSLGNAAGDSQDSNIPETQRFSLTEEIRVKQIFELLREYKVIQDRAIDEFQFLNNLNSDVLDRMRQEFVGHHIIQHMDAVHVFANSFTRDETPLYDSSLGQMFQNTTEALMSIDDTKAKISDDFIDQERAQVAPDIPLMIYKIIRNPHLFRGTGPQIWQGIVTGVVSSYAASDGVYSVNIDAKDNIHFMDMSTINTSPGLTQLQGALEDPLTPYDLKVEPSTGLIESINLLPENIKRLEAGVIKFHDYPFLGKDVNSQEELFSDTSQSSESKSRTMRHVYGLLYRWKRGILSVTQNINMRRPLGDSFATPEDIEKDYGLTVLSNVFAKLDAADILSILICGKPYNYNTFIRAAIDSGSLTLNNDGGSGNYFDYLFDIFEESNPTLGSFSPAISSAINREKASQLAQFEQDTSRSLGRINSLQKKLAGIRDKISDIKQSDRSSIVNEQLKLLEVEQAGIQQSLSKIKTSMSNVGDIKIFGDDIVQHFNDNENDELSKATQYILLKKPEDVKYNRDGNFFVVSDRYSSDLTIQAFIQDLQSTNGFDPFTNTYKKPIEIAKSVAETLHFELFADSQGNINFRPPEYNKIPLSLLLKLIQLGQTDGVSLVPPFIENLVRNRAQTFSDRLLVTELEIRERVAFLGGIQKLNDFAEGGQFGGGLQYVTRSHPSSSNGLVAYAVDDFSVRQANAASVAFTEDTQSDLALENLDSESWPTSLNENEIVTEVMSVRNQLRQLTGYPTKEYLSDSTDDRYEILNELSKYTNSGPNPATERLRLTNEISIRVSKRQTLINAIVRLQDQQSSISDASVNGPGALLSSFYSAMVQDTSSIFTEEHIPKFLQDMIINDLQNTLGRNSGKRFIIEDEVILDMRFEINAPEFTRVDIYGSENLLGQGPDTVTGVPLAFWAGATDYDMWRQFGYRSARPETIPYLTNPETQLAPYAVMKLMQERGRLHAGEIQVIGNEHYQVGETVYVANKEMLYYIEQVSHSIDLSSNSFKTTLKLSYGRPLGQYIPQPFDIIGRTLLGDAKRGGLDQRVNRAPPATSHVKILETLYLPADMRGSITAGVSAANAEGFLKENIDKIKNAVIKANSVIQSNNGNNIKIEIRGFAISERDSLSGSNASGSPAITPSENLIKNYIGEVRKMMTTGSYPESNVELNDIISVNVSAISDKISQNPQKVEDKYFKQKNEPGVVVYIDKKLTDDDIKYRRMPSQKAWMTGSRDSSGSNLGLPTHALDIALIVDRNVKGDTEGEKNQGEHKLPPPSDGVSISTRIPDNDMETV